MGAVLTALNLGGFAGSFPTQNRRQHIFLRQDLHMSTGRCTLFGQGLHMSTGRSSHVNNKVLSEMWLGERSKYEGSDFSHGEAHPAKRLGKSAAVRGVRAAAPSRSLPRLGSVRRGVIPHHGGALQLSRNGLVAFQFVGDYPSPGRDQASKYQN